MVNDTVRLPAAPKVPKKPLPPLDAQSLEDETVIRNCWISGLDLNDLALRAVSFENCVFQRVNLIGTSWQHLRLLDVSFEECDLSSARWPEASLERVSFTDCRLLGFQSPQARCRHVRFTRVQAGLALWYKLDGKNVWWQDSDLSEASFLEAKLPGAVFRMCKLHRTDFLGAALTGGDLRGSDLTKTRLGLREVAGVTVEAAQLLDLASLLDVTVKALEEN
ncbi:pentapeptide repeat-containing protein [Deinococcus cavernae]|nr:pentapeptide repeat-containing protein [Deinococcus cavernae]